MADEFTDSKRRPPSRLKVIGVGLLLGAAWGAAMWGIFVATGRPADPRVLFYLMVSTAMIGGGVAAFFGAADARKRGERVSPKVGRKK